MKKIYVTKYDGRKEPYSQEKVVSSILRSGVKEEDVLTILSKVEDSLYPDIPTSKIYQLITEEINKKSGVQPARFYRLREALGKMDPISFERFIKKILEKEKYQCQWDLIVKGFCIGHQLDVIAKTGQDVFYVEVKHRRNPHRFCGLGTVAEIWARFDDLQKGFREKKDQHDFSQAWLITNSKFSSHAKQYAKCKGIKLTGWRHTYNGGGQKKDGLEKQIEKLGETEIDRMIKSVLK